MPDETIYDIQTEAYKLPMSTTFLEVDGAGTPRITRKMQLKRLLGSGAGNYADSTYTSGSPLSVNNALVQLTCDGLGAATVKDLPLTTGGTAFELWDTSTNTIRMQEDWDTWTLRISFVASSATASSYCDIKLDIGTGGSPVYISQETLIFTKGAGVAQNFSVTVAGFSRATFLANGCKIMLDSTSSGHNISVWDIGVFVNKHRHGS